MRTKNISSKPIKISIELYNKAKIVSKIENRSVNKQIEYWAKMGKIADDNPDLSLDLIREILISKEEISEGKCSEYQLD